MKNISLACLLFFATTSVVVKAQHDSGTVKHPKINLKYAYRYRVKYGVYYKDSTLFGYYFGNDSSYAWSFSKSGNDPLMDVFMKDDKDAYKQIKKIRRINTIEFIPKAIAVTGYGALVITTYVGLTVAPILDIGALCVSGGVMGVGYGFVALCENAKQKSFLKGVKLYNRDYGYL